MQIGVQRGGMFRRFSRWCYRQMSTWWASYLIYPLVVSAPTGLILANFTVKELREGVQSWQPLWLTTLINDYPFVSFGSAFLYIATIKAISGAIRYFGREEIDPNKPLILLRLLREIVSHKTERFERVRKNVKAGAIKSSQDAFLNLTKPDQQIAACAHSLYSYFSVSSGRKAEFRVAVAHVKNGELEKWYCCAPTDDPPATSIEQLRDNDSAISQALRSKSTVIVENTKKALKKNAAGFIRTRSGGINARGSLICTPIINSEGEVPFVICISCYEPRYFRASQRLLYDWVFRHFALRIQLESALQDVKDSITH